VAWTDKIPNCPEDAGKHFWVFFPPSPDQFKLGVAQSIDILDKVEVWIADRHWKEDEIKKDGLLFWDTPIDRPPLPGIVLVSPAVEEDQSCRCRSRKEGLKKVRPNEFNGYSSWVQAVLGGGSF